MHHVWVSLAKLPDFKKLLGKELPKQHWPRSWAASLPARSVEAERPQVPHRKSLVELQTLGRFFCISKALGLRG